MDPRSVHGDSLHLALWLELNAEQSDSPKCMIIYKSKYSNED